MTKPCFSPVVDGDDVIFLGKLLFYFKKRKRWEDMGESGGTPHKHGGGMC